MLTKDCEWENQSPGRKHDDGDNIFAQICLKGHTPGRGQLQWCPGDGCLEPLLLLVSLVQSPFQRWRAECSVCRDKSQNNALQAEQHSCLSTGTIKDVRSFVKVFLQPQRTWLRLDLRRGDGAHNAPLENGPTGESSL